MAKDNYEFEDDDQGTLSALGKKLLQSGKSKDALVKLLKQAGVLLEPLSQTSPTATEACADLARALVQKHIIGHKDKDVRIYAAQCLAHVLRVHAPESPYTDSTLQEVFALLLWVFRKLENPSTPSFQLCLSILDTVSQVNCCLLMLDFETDDMVCDLFKVLLDSINVNNEESVKAGMSELMSCMIDEADTVSDEFLSVLLTHLVASSDTADPATSRLTKQVMQRTKERLQPYLQKYLTNVIQGDAEEIDLDVDPHTLLFQVHQACPQTLLPVLPHLEQELQTNDMAKRLAAVDLVGKLFSLPESDLDMQYGRLLALFLQRFRDEKVEVRVAAVQFSSKLLKHCSSAASRGKVLEAAVDRVRDFEDKVRLAGIEAISSAAVSDLSCVNLGALEAIAERLRDKKVPVRKEAAAKLLAVFKAHCMRHHDGLVVSSDEELVIWIPPRLLVAATSDSVLRDVVLRAGFFPSKLSPEAAARQWGAIYMHADAAERTALMKLLKSRCLLQRDVAAFLQLRTACRDGEQPASKMQEVVHRIAAASANSIKTEEALLKLKDLKDNHIFKGLEALAAAGTSAEAAQAAAKDVIQRTGSRGAIGDAVKGLCHRLAPALLAPEHLTALLGLAASEGKAGDGSGPFLDAVLGLLTAASSAAPHLFAQLVGPTAALLNADNAACLAGAARVLANAGGYMRAYLSVAKETPPADLKAALLGICAEGPAAASKAAVQALVSVYDAAAAKDAAALAKQLMAGLEKVKAASGTNMMPALHAMSAIGRVLPEVFAQHAVRLLAVVEQQVLLLPAAKTKKKNDADVKAGKVWGHFSPHIQLKASALKALARGCVPRDPTKRTPEATLQVVDSLTELLAPMLEPGADMEELNPAGSMDKAVMRLAAAEALLRLSRGHDTRMGAAAYFALALMMQDQVLDVRAVFAAKVYRTVAFFQSHQALHQKAAKYAAMLFLAGMDPGQDNKTAALKKLADFVAARRLAASRAVASAAIVSSDGGTLLHEYPDFMLPFAIQVLAHHPDFPQQEDLDDEDGLELLQPFQTMLQFGLEPLLVPLNGGETGASLPAINTILRTLKHTEDATPLPCTPNIYILSDMGLALSHAIFAAQEKGAKVAPQGKYPGKVPLPSGFYRPLPSSVHGRQLDGSHLPRGLKVQVAELFMERILHAVAPGKKRKAPTGRTHPKKELTKAATPAKPRRIKADEAGSTAQSRGDKRKAAAGSAQKQRRSQKKAHVSESEDEEASGASSEDDDANDSDEEDVDRSKENMPSTAGRAGTQQIPTSPAEQELKKQPVRSPKRKAHEALASPGQPKGGSLAKRHQKPAGGSPSITNDADAPQQPFPSRATAAAAASPARKPRQSLTRSGATPMPASPSSSHKQRGKRAAAAPEAADAPRSSPRLRSAAASPADAAEAAVASPARKGAGKSPAVKQQAGGKSKGAAKRQADLRADTSDEGSKLPRSSPANSAPTSKQESRGKPKPKAKDGSKEPPKLRAAASSRGEKRTRR